MSLLLERLQIAAGFVPVNMATAANPGDWVSLKYYSRLLVLFFAGAGDAGEPPTITLEQATAVAGTGAKALNFTTLYAKSGADIQAVAQWSKITQAAANTYAMAAGNTQKILAIEIDAEDLDVANGFDCVRASVGDVGSTSQIGCVVYLAADPKYGSAPAGMNGIIAD